MLIFKNGTTKDDLIFNDLCKIEHEIRIAYNNEGEIFKIDNITNTMVEFPYWKPIAKAWPQISYDHEILMSFFSNFKIKPTWINCNYTWGWFDDETGHWTGAVGQVEIINKSKIFQVHFLSRLK